MTKKTPGPVPASDIFTEMLRIQGEAARQVMQTFARNLGVKVIHVDATDQFMGHLKGVSDPEAKRKTAAYANKVPNIHLSRYDGIRARNVTIQNELIKMVKRTVLRKNPKKNVQKIGNF